MTYYAIRDHNVVAAGGDDCRQWSVWKGIMLWKERDGAMFVLPGFIVTERVGVESSAVWVDYYPVSDTGELIIDVDAHLDVDVIASADLERLL